MEVDDDSATEATAAPRPSLPSYILSEPQPSILTAPLTAHFTALSPHSTFQHIQSIHRVHSTTTTTTTTSAITATPTAPSTTAQPIPLYRYHPGPLPASNPNKRPRHNKPPPPTATAAPTTATAPLPAPERPTPKAQQGADCRYVVAFSTAEAAVGLQLLGYVSAWAGGSVLVALVDGGRSVTVLRVAEGIVPMTAHAKVKKGKAVAQKAPPVGAGPTLSSGGLSSSAGHDR